MPKGSHVCSLRGQRAGLGIYCDPIQRKSSATQPGPSLWNSTGKCRCSCDSLWQPQYWVDVWSAASQNFMLQAEELGIGTVWLAVYPCEDRMERIAQELELPANVIPLCIIPMGYPAEVRMVGERYKKEKIHDERW